MSLLLSVPDRSDNRDMTYATTHPCQHQPACPSAGATDQDAAHVTFGHPEQGWSLLCNGVILFEDFGDISPDSRSTGSPREAMRGTSPHRLIG